MKSFKILPQEFKRKQKDKRKMGMLFYLSLKTALWLNIDYLTKIQILLILIILIFCKLRISTLSSLFGLSVV